MDPEKLKVVDLRKELQQRGLDNKGNKAVLVKRLRDALDSESGKAPAKSVEQDPLEDDNDDDEDAEPEEESVKEEPKSPKKEPAKTTSSKKDVTPPTPKKVVKEEPKTPAKAVKVEPKLPARTKTSAEPEENGEQEEESEKDEEPQNKEVKPEKMDTETRGEKRKRDDDDEDETEELETKEKKRREDSPTKSPQKSSPTKAEKVKTPVKPKEKLPPKEDEPEIDNEKPQLSWFDSDLNLKIDNKTFLSAKPLNDGCFGYVWAGARATHGISSGKVCFEVKVTEELKWDDPADKMQEKTDKVLKDRFRIDRRKPQKGDGKKDEAKPAEGDKDEKEKSTEVKPEENGEKSAEKMETDETKSEEEKPSETVKEEKSDEAPKEEAEAKDNNDAIKAETEEDKEKTETEEGKEKTESEEDKEKTKTEAAKAKEEEKPKLPPLPKHFFRVGFSLLGSSLQLGETKHSYAYESTGKFVTDKEFQDYGVAFTAGDVVGAYLSIDDSNVSITFSVNGVAQPTAITVPRSEFPENFSLFPHVLCRNFSYEINFGAQEEPWFPHAEELKDYPFLQAVEEKVAGPVRPAKREECEVLLMIGLPGSGKTHWVKNHIATSTDKCYTVIGNHPLFDRMTVDCQPMKSCFRGSWKILVDRIQKVLNQLTDQAAQRRRNYIIDQTNVFPNAQRRKLRGFEGFQRKAVIVVCEDEEHASRQKDQQNDYGKSVPESTMFDLKAQMELPQKCEWVEELIFTDLDEEEAKNKVKFYNEDANKKGYFKRWQVSRQNEKKTQPPRNVRGRRGGFAGPGRFDRHPQGPGGWQRPAPGAWGGPRRDWGPPAQRGGFGMARRGGLPPPRGGVRPQEPSIRGRDNRGGYSAGRNQVQGRNANAWQGSGGGSGNWGAGNSHGGWNASIYGSHGYGAWNQGTGGQQAGGQQQPAWKFGGNQGYNSSNTSQRYGATQGGGYGSSQGGYGGGQGGYGGGNQGGYGSNQQGGYGSQGGYNSGSQGYGSQAGYGQQQGWNYYGAYGQQQGWGNQQGQAKAKHPGNSANYSQNDWAQSARQYAQQQQQWSQPRRQ